LRTGTVCGMLDGAQAAPHQAVDVQDLDCDFYAFSGHKLCGPTGIGALYGKAKAAGEDATLPGRRRHDTFRDLREDHLQRHPVQIRGGYPAYHGGDRAGCGDRLLERYRPGPDPGLRSHIARLRNRTSLGTERCQIIGTARKKAAVLSFEIKGVHPHDVGTILNEDGIAIRTAIIAPSR